MFNTNNFKTLFLSVILLFVSACEDDHDHDHDHDAHIDAEGFILESDGTEIYRQFEGAVVVNNLNLVLNILYSSLFSSISFITPSNSLCDLVGG